MSVRCNGITYSSQKHPLLEYIFKKYNPNLENSIQVIPFTLHDISEAYDNLQIEKIDKYGHSTIIKKPTSTSNTILDLVRKDNGIRSRLPQSIIDLGYDLRKRTGPEQGANNFAGEFVFVGIGNALHSWFACPEDISQQQLFSYPIPEFVKPHIRKDEAALFSVMDYCDVMSIALFTVPNVVYPVQHPLKWQPNEIDGFYMAHVFDQIYLYPVEAKALSTNDNINLDQILGGAQTAAREFANVHAHIVPIAVQMITNGIRLAKFKEFDSSIIPDSIEIERAFQFTFYPPIPAWNG